METEMMTAEEFDKENLKHFTKEYQLSHKANPCVICGKDTNFISLSMLIEDKVVCAYCCVKIYKYVKKINDDAKRGINVD